MFLSKCKINELTRTAKFFKATNLSKLTYYEILEIAKSAPVDEIKKSYYKKVKLYHPDHNKEDPTAEENFKVLVKAYETLKDPVKRQMYNLSFKNSNFKEQDSMEYEESFSSNEGGSFEKKEYYQNRWYGYNKPKEETLRDEYHQNRKKVNKEEVVWKFILLRLGIISFIILGCDFWKYRKQMRMHDKYFIQKEVFNEAEKETRTVIQTKNKIEINLSDYIDERVKVNETN